MSVRKVEQWQVSWPEGHRPRSRKFDKKPDAESFGSKLEREQAVRASIRKVDQWEVRWREGGRDSRRRQRTIDRKGDAETFDREVKRRKQLGELATWEKRNHTVRELGANGGRTTRCPTWPSGRSQATSRCSSSTSSAASAVCASAR